eukprot:TRINITY_DN19711_c0_g1_i7.p3 TRINITY_DN19711_c0_g1~~TRINITY_DN19711_c0_g1_i7.p3  ORF type:complete len:238 (-),score=-19.86 TRINITY_DN19711_c0_g1_i7:211-924(-)
MFHFYIFILPRQFQCFISNLEIYIYKCQYQHYFFSQDAVYILIFFFVSGCVGSYLFQNNFIAILNLALLVQGRIFSQIYSQKFKIYSIQLQKIKVVYQIQICVKITTYFPFLYKYSIFLYFINVQIKKIFKKRLQKQKGKFTLHNLYTYIQKLCRVNFQDHFKHKDKFLIILCLFLERVKNFVSTSLQIKKFVLNFGMSNNIIKYLAACVYGQKIYVKILWRICEKYLQILQCLNIC